MDAGIAQSGREIDQIREGNGGQQSDSTPFLFATLQPNENPVPHPASIPGELFQRAFEL